LGAFLSVHPLDLLAAQLDALYYDCVVELQK